jgi:hypothetical protein
MKMSLKKYVSSLTLIAIASLSFGCRIMPSTASTVKTSYSESLEIFPNPERGFYVPFNPEPYRAFSPLQLSDLEKYRNENISLVRRFYLIPDRFAPLPTSFLDLISQDLQTAREAGIKLIIRFTYNWIGGGEDASKDIILSHMEQLEPILRENYDAIAYLHAGFIGYWGEWNRSTNDLLNTTDKRDILFKLLSVVPTERMVALRYPHDKTRIYDNENPLTSSEAFNGSNRARTGAINDCFLASIDNRGTYKSTNISIIEDQKNFLNQDNQYVVQGGESCSSNSEAQPYIGCDNALQELKQMRWSAINSRFEQGVLDTWRNEGCFGEIERRLGYRFRLINSEISNSLKPGGKFFAKLEIENVGWASPYNPRLLEVVLRNRETNQEYYLRVNEDPRRWLPGSSNNVNVEAGLPESITPGEYDVFLNLPDPTSELYNRPEYSIRLANVDTWEKSTGYNSLLRSIDVDPNAGGDSYGGKDYFESR